MSRPSKPPPLPARPARSRRKPRRNFLIWIFAGSLIAGISVFLLAYAYYSARAAMVNINVIHEMPKASILYDYQGHPFSRFFDENRIALPADQPVPKLLAEAVVATEDRRFYEHGAIDPIGMARAAFSNLIGRGSRQGGSTITQQLGRNSIGQLQRTYDRKLLEIFLAHRIEQNYTKEQILRYYLDRIYFGQGLYGAETTANAFFGVSAKKLNLAQCALLAGMISSPNSSSPWKDVKAAKAARSRALVKMVRANYITQAQADAAEKAPLSLRPRPDFGGGFATSEVRRQLELQLDPDLIQQGGLKIYTTIDPRLQTIAENSLQQRINEIDAANGENHKNGYGDPDTGLPDQNLLQGAVFAMDPASGAIRAVVGSRDFAESQFNRAALARRQIGSTIKPLLYATAFAERGYCPASSIDASKFDLTKPQTAQQVSPDYIHVNDALVRSDNYAAMRMGMIVGPDLLNTYAKRCGITTDIPPFPSSYLGACDVSLNELTGVFATLANQGTWWQQHIVTKVLDDRNNVIYAYHPDGHAVFTPQIARQVTGMMENVVSYGTGAAIRQQYGFTAPAAGKTGTTNDYKDAWFEGFTSNLAVGVWIGYDTPRQIMHGGYAAAVALPVWVNIMKQAQPPAYRMDPFPVPPGLERVNVGGDLFGQGGEPYYLTPAQRDQLGQEPTSNPTGENDDQDRPSGKNILDKFLDIFR